MKLFRLIFAAATVAGRELSGRIGDPALVAPDWLLEKLDGTSFAGINRNVKKDGKKLKLNGKVKCDNVKVGRWRIFGTKSEVHIELQ